MKMSIILFLTLIVSCGKQADFDGRGIVPTAPVDNDPVGVVPNEPVVTDGPATSFPIFADIQYSCNTNPSTEVKTCMRDSGSNGTLIVSNQGFRIPQELTVTQGWAGIHDTATITLKQDGPTITCTYRSKAVSQSHNNISNTPEEKQNGLSYAFSNCSDTTIDPTVTVDAFDILTLTVVSADNLQTKTEVKAEIKVYQ